jgi:hypothetical protein
MARGGERRRLVLDKGATHMVLEALPEAASTMARREVKHGDDKLINGRHRTSPSRRPTPPFFSGELPGELLSAFFSLISWLEG